MLMRVLVITPCALGMMTVFPIAKRFSSESASWSLQSINTWTLSGHDLTAFAVHVTDGRQLHQLQPDVPFQLGLRCGTSRNVLKGFKICSASLVTSEKDKVHYRYMYNVCINLHDFGHYSTSTDSFIVLWMNYVHLFHVQSLDSRQSR